MTNQKQLSGQVHLK